MNVQITNGPYTGVVGVLGVLLPNNHYNVHCFVEYEEKVLVVAAAQLGHYIGAVPEFQIINGENKASTTSTKKKSKYKDFDLSDCPFEDVDRNIKFLINKVRYWKNLFEKSFDEKSSVFVKGP